jgi:hypothetical protein
MFRYCSLFLLAIAFVSSSVLAAPTASRTARSSASEITVNISRTPVRKLIEEGKFEGGHRVRVIPGESIKPGKRQLWFVRPAKEFKSVVEIVGYLNSIGLEPAGYRELLEFAIQEPNILVEGETVYALGSPAKLTSGADSWQCVGTKDNRRFVSDTVEGEDRPTNAYYLAKRKTTK